VCEPDRGLSDAMNKGIAMATGVAIGWLNADDLYLPEALSTAVSASAPFVRKANCARRERRAG
jgi:glycosyltransferase involved in cell wall biosynthesis